MKNKISTVAVVGAGAVGSYFGGLLARAGHDVTLIARPKACESHSREWLIYGMPIFSRACSS